MDKMNGLYLEAGKMSTEMMAILYGGLFDALKETLKAHNVPSCFYSIMDTYDESMCLICEDGVWKTFMFERGQRTGEKTFDDVLPACYDLMSHFADDKEEYAEMQAMLAEKAGNEELLRKEPTKKIFEFFDSLAKKVASFPL